MNNWSWYFHYFFMKTCCGKKHLAEAFLMSTHKNLFVKKLKKKYIYYPELWIRIWKRAEIRLNKFSTSWLLIDDQPVLTKIDEILADSQLQTTLFIPTLDTTTNLILYRNIYFGYVLESPQWGDSNKYPKHMYYEKIRINHGLSYILFCQLKILYISKFIITATSLRTNDVVVTRVHNKLKAVFFLVVLLLSFQ